MVKTRLLPMLAEALGRDTLEVNLGGNTIKDLIEELIRRYGRKAKESLLSEDGEFDTMIQLVLNEERWIPGDKLDTPLKEGDSVALMLLIGGG